MVEVHEGVRTMLHMVPRLYWVPSMCFSHTWNQCQYAGSLGARGGTRLDLGTMRLFHIRRDGEHGLTDQSLKEAVNLVKVAAPIQTFSNPSTNMTTRRSGAMQGCL
jgi:hypothetical protein